MKGWQIAAISIVSVIVVLFGILFAAGWNETVQSEKYVFAFEEEVWEGFWKIDSLYNEALVLVGETNERDAIPLLEEAYVIHANITATMGDLLPTASTVDLHTTTLKAIDQQWIGLNTVWNCIEDNACWSLDDQFTKYIEHRGEAEEIWVRTLVELGLCCG